MLPSIVLIGASGWFGMSFIGAGLEKFGVKFLDYVTLVTSDGRDLTHPLHRTPLGTVSLKSLNARSENNHEVVIQAAFATRNRIESLGETEYLRVNNGIIESVESYIVKSNPSKIYLISSGAVYGDESLYGRLKRIEEQRIERAFSGDELIIFRVFGATGRFCDYRDWSAVCQFIRSGLAGRSISIRAVGSVLRSYTSFDDLSDIILNRISSRLLHASSILDATGQVISLVEVADIVASHYKTTVELPNNFKPEVVLDSYCGDPSNYASLAQNSGTPLMSLREQLEAQINNAFIESYTRYA